MKVVSKYIFTLVAFFALGGCASGPGFDEYATSIPPMPDDSGRIYIYRVTTLGAALQPSIRVNDEVVGKATAKGFVYVDRPAGNYEISTSTEVERSLSLTLEPGDERYVRLEVKFGVFVGHVKPVLVERAVGREEIAKTKYIGG